MGGKGRRILLIARPTLETWFRRRSADQEREGETTREGSSNAIDCSPIFARGEVKITGIVGLEAEENDVFLLPKRSEAKTNNLLSGPGPANLPEHGRSDSGHDLRLGGVICT